MYEYDELELVEIPAGHFTMGDVWGDGDPDELPTAQVMVPGFRLGTYVVSNRQFLRFLNANGDYRTATGEVFIDLRSRHSPIRWEGGRFVCKDDYADYPVTSVNWHGALAYCEWLGAQTGLPLRLPSEIEWQYASMGSRALKWSLSDTFRAEDYICSSHGPGPVHSGAASDWGLFAMTGNVFEWCADEYRFSLAADDDSNVLPQNRVIKGGAFILSDSMNFRNAKRFSCHEQSCLFSIGFRVAATLAR